MRGPSWSELTSGLNVLIVAGIGLLMSLMIKKQFEAVAPGQLGSFKALGS